MERSDTRECPRCGRGRLVDIGYDGGTSDEEGRPIQLADSREVQTYSCGHIIGGPSLATADAEVLDVERRDSVEPAAPLPDEEADR
jgi:hypothetical protein